jgi:hypothetical protein
MRPSAATNLGRAAMGHPSKPSRSSDLKADGCRAGPVFDGDSFIRGLLPRVLNEVFGRAFVRWRRLRPQPWADLAGRRPCPGDSTCTASIYGHGGRVIVERSQRVSYFWPPGKVKRVPAVSHTVPRGDPHGEPPGSTPGVGVQSRLASSQRLGLSVNHRPGACHSEKEGKGIR